MNCAVCNVGNKPGLRVSVYLPKSGYNEIKVLCPACVSMALNGGAKVTFLGPTLTGTLKPDVTPARRAAEELHGYDTTRVW